MRLLINITDIVNTVTNFPHRVLLNDRQVANISKAFANNSAMNVKLKRIFGSGTTTFIISNKEMECITEIVKCLEDPNLLMKSIPETIENETKEQKRGFRGMLFGGLGASLNAKGVIRAG